MGMVKFITQMVIRIQAIGKMAYFMDKEFIHMLISKKTRCKNTQAIFYKVIRMEKANILILKVEFLKGHGNWAKERVKVVCIRKMR